MFTKYETKLKTYKRLQEEVGNKLIPRNHKFYLKNLSTNEIITFNYKTDCFDWLLQKQLAKKLFEFGKISLFDFEGRIIINYKDNNKSYSISCYCVEDLITHLKENKDIENIVFLKEINEVEENGTNKNNC